MFVLLSLRRPRGKRTRREAAFWMALSKIFMPCSLPRFARRLNAGLKGWRGSLKLFSVMSWILAAANMAASVVITARSGDRSPAGSVTIVSGLCDDVTKSNLWIHLAINAVSVSLLAATNFAMQTWTALTRDEIELVHDKGETVDVGIPSLRNMTRISHSRRLMWAIMFLAAAPFHFIYNSTLYTTSSASDYTVYIMTEAGFSTSFKNSSSKYSPVENMPQFQRNGHLEWEAMPLPALLGRYGTGFADKYRDVVFIADTYEGNYGSTGGVDEGILYKGVMRAWGDIQQSRWICDLFDRQQLDYGDSSNPPLNASCHSARITGMSRPRWDVDLNLLNWQLEPLGWGGGSHVATLQPWALSERTDLDCRLLAYPMFWWLATACNFVIASCLTGMVLFYNSTPLVTIGDVIDSYLSNPSTKVNRSACTYSYGDFKNIYRPELRPREYRLRSVRRWRAVGLMRWGLTIVWWLIALFAASAGFAKGLRSERDFTDTSMRGMIDRGLGALNRVSMLLPELAGSASRVRRVQLVVLASTPQVVMAITYLLYNSLLTIMAVEGEWHAFGRKPKALRVSQPRGDQRDTFFLGLPYRYAIPFVALSAVLQWLVGQSLFFAEVDLWDEGGNRLSDEKSILTLGYSSLAMFWLLLVGFTSWLPIVLIGSVGSLPPGMPILGSCSAVIAASCHPSEEMRYKGDVAAHPLSWGVLRGVDDDGIYVNWLGFSSGVAQAPDDGHVYG